MLLRAWAIAQNYFVSWHLSEKHLVYAVFERKVEMLLPKKVPKQKTCQIPRKPVICNYVLLNITTAKNIKFGIQRLKIKMNGII